MSRADAGKDMRLLVIVHIYYEHLWPELAEGLRCLKEPFDLRVTCVRRGEEVAAMVRESFPSAHVETVENRGFDMGPFFHVLNGVDLNDYDAVVKLHTKRDIPLGYVMRGKVEGPDFRERLLRFTRSGTCWERALKRLFRRGTGMVGEGGLALNRFSDPLRDYGGVEEVLHRAGLVFRGGFFVAGSMFIIRAPLLKVFQHRWCMEDFEVPDRTKGDGLPHFQERALGYAVYSQGFCLRDWNGRFFVPGAASWRVRYLAAERLRGVLRFFQERGS